MYSAEAAEVLYIEYLLWFATELEWLRWRDILSLLFVSSYTNCTCGAHLLVRFGSLF